MRGQLNINVNYKILIPTNIIGVCSVPAPIFSSATDARKLDDSQARAFLDASYIDGHEWLKPFDDLLIAPVATP